MTTKVTETVIDRVTTLMREKDISYADLAKNTSSSKSALQRYFTGNTKKIPIDVVEEIAPVLGVSAPYLMGWEDKVKANLSEESDIKVHNIAAHATRDLTEEEAEEVLKFAEFVKAKRIKDK